MRQMGKVGVNKCTSVNRGRSQWVEYGFTILTLNISSESNDGFTRNHMYISSVNLYII